MCENPFGKSRRNGNMSRLLTDPSSSSSSSSSKMSSAPSIVNVRVLNVKANIDANTINGEFKMATRRTPCCDTDSELNYVDSCADDQKEAFFVARNLYDEKRYPSTVHKDFLQKLVLNSYAWDVKTGDDRLESLKVVNGDNVYPLSHQLDENGNERPRLHVPFPFPIKMMSSNDVRIIRFEFNAGSQTMTQSLLADFLSRTPADASCAEKGVFYETISNAAIATQLSQKLGTSSFPRKRAHIALLGARIMSVTNTTQSDFDLKLEFVNLNYKKNAQAHRFRPMHVPHGVRTASQADVDHACMLAASKSGVEGEANPNGNNGGSGGGNNGDALSSHITPTYINYMDEDSCAYGVNVPANFSGDLSADASALYRIEQRRFCSPETRRWFVMNLVQLESDLRGIKKDQGNEVWVLEPVGAEAVAPLTAINFMVLTHMKELIGMSAEMGKAAPQLCLLSEQATVNAWAINYDAFVATARMLYSRYAEFGVNLNAPIRLAWTPKHGVDELRTNGAQQDARKIYAPVTLSAYVELIFIPKDDEDILSPDAIQNLLDPASEWERAYIEERAAFYQSYKDSLAKPAAATLPPGSVAVPQVLIDRIAADDDTLQSYGRAQQPSTPMETAAAVTPKAVALMAPTASIAAAATAGGLCPPVHPDTLAAKAAIAAGIAAGMLALKEEKRSAKKAKADAVLAAASAAEAATNAAEAAASATEAHRKLLLRSTNMRSAKP